MMIIGVLAGLLYLPSTLAAWKVLFRAMQSSMTVRDNVTTLVPGRRRAHACISGVEAASARASAHDQEI